MARSKINIKAGFISFNFLMFFVALYLLSTSPNNATDTDASQARYLVTKSIVERLDLSIPDGLGIKGVDGRDYSWYGLGQSLLAIPFYIVGKYIGTPENAFSIMNQLLGAAVALLILLFSTLLGYSKRTSLYVAILYGLCTFAWPLAKQPFDHTIETFFILLSIYFTYCYIIREKLLYLVIAGFSLGFAFITRQTSVLVIPPLFVLMIIYYLKRYNLKTTATQMIRDIALFSLVFLPFIGLSLWYNHYRFGSIFETGYQLIAERTGIDFFTGTSLLTGLRGFLLSPGKGFFYYSPVAILFFFGIKSFFKKNLELALCFILIILSYLFFLSKNLYWHGDWAWGPRYLLIITPFLIIPIAELFESKVWSTKLSVRAFVYLLVAVSFIIQIAAVSVYFQKYFFHLMFENKEQFTIVHGVGVQPIIEPATENYFYWHKSPIFAQFRFIYLIAHNLNDYQFSKLSKDAAENEIVRADPRLNLFDFWWLHKYFLNGSYSGFINALLLLLITIYCALRLWQLSH